MKTIVLKLTTLFLCLFVLNACDDDASISPCDIPVYINSTQQDSLLVSQYLTETIFVTENTRDACYAYALDYIDEEIEKNSKNGPGCYTMEYRYHHKRVSQTDEKFISKKTDLSLSDVEHYAGLYCNLDYGKKPSNLSSFEIKYETIFFNYNIDGQDYRGELSSNVLSFLACPIYSIGCYTYLIQPGEED